MSQQYVLMLDKSKEPRFGPVPIQATGSFVCSSPHPTHIPAPLLLPPHRKACGFSHQVHAPSREGDIHTEATQWHHHTPTQDQSCSHRITTPSASCHSHQGHEGANSAILPTVAPLRAHLPSREVSTSVPVPGAAYLLTGSTTAK